LEYVCIKILFSEIDAAAAVIADSTSFFEEKDGLPIEAFAKVQEIFSHVDWMNPKADAALNVLQQISTSAIMNDKLDKVSDQHVETATSLGETGPKTPQKNSYKAIQSLSSTKRSPNNYMSGKEEKTNKVDAIPQRANTSDIISQEKICSSEKSLESSKCPTGSTNFDIKPQESHLASSGSADSSLSPGTPPPRPPLTTRSKKIHDSPPHTELPPHHILPSQSGPQSQDRSYSPISSSTPGTHHSLSADSKIEPSPPLSSKTPSNDIRPVKTRLESPPSQPPTPPPPPTPPLKDQNVVRAGPLSPPPPPPSPKKELHVKAGPPTATTVPSHMIEKPHVRDGLSPPPPPPPLPPSPPLKAEQPTMEAASPITAPPAPPPPPSATLSSGNPNAALQKSPPIPPPPIPFGKGLKPGSAFPMSLSVGGDGNKVSCTTGPQSSSSTGSKGRVLSRAIDSKNDSKKLKPLHWMKLSRAVKGSLWDETQKSGEASK